MASIINPFVADGRLVIPQAITDDKGQNYHISIGLGGSQLRQPLTADQKARIVILVRGCFDALQRDFAEREEEVPDFEQIGFVVNRLPPDLLQISALITQVGKTAIRALSSSEAVPEVSDLKTEEKSWSPEQIQELRWKDPKPTSYTIEDALKELYHCLPLTSVVVSKEPSPHEAENPSVYVPRYPRLTLERKKILEQALKQYQGSSADMDPFWKEILLEDLLDRESENERIQRAFQDIREKRASEDAKALFRLLSALRESGLAYYQKEYDRVPEFYNCLMRPGQTPSQYFAELLQYDLLDRIME